MSHPFQTIEACSLMDPLPRSVVSLLHGEVRPTCSANGQKVAIIGTLTLPLLILCCTEFAVVVNTLSILNIHIISIA